MRDSNVVEQHHFDGDLYPHVAFESNANSDRSGSSLPLLCDPDPERPPFSSDEMVYPFVRHRPRPEWGA